MAQLVATFATVAALSASCDRPQQTVPAPEATLLTGAGATFPYPVYSRWFSDYYARTGVRINYFSVGSNDGIAMLLADSVDFGASDIPLADSQLVRGSERRFAQLPMVAGGVVIVFNVPGVSELNLDAETLGGLLIGRIRNWNDKAILRLNPNHALPSLPVTFVHRDDLSGTTVVLDTYLRSASSEWRARQGDAKTARWAVGEGEHGNEGISGRVKATIGAMGYVPLAYAQLYRLPSARLRNSSGAFIAASSHSVEAAARSLHDENSSVVAFRTASISEPSPDAYPIVTATWVVFPVAPANAARGRAVRAFVRWALSQGESGASALGYAPLPPKLVKQLDSLVAAIPGNSGAQR